MIDHWLPGVLGIIGIIGNLGAVIWFAATMDARLVRVADTIATIEPEVQAHTTRIVTLEQQQANADVASADLRGRVSEMESTLQRVAAIEEKVNGIQRQTDRIEAILSSSTTRR